MVVFCLTGVHIVLILQLSLGISSSMHIPTQRSVFITDLTKTKTGIGCQFDQCMYSVAPATVPWQIFTHASPDTVFSVDHSS